MKILKTAIAIILFISLSTAAYSQGESSQANGEIISAQEKPAPAKQDDDRLPIFKEGWQIMVAPYMWIPGAHLNINQQGTNTKAVVPWYTLVPVLFSQAIGGMGSIEIWYNQWGIFSDSNFLYMSDSVSGGGARIIELKSDQLPVAIPVRLDLSGKLTIWTRLFWQDVGVRRLVGVIPLKADQQLPALSCELYGGLRYTYINQDVKLDLNATLTGPQGKVQITRGGYFYSSSEFSFIEPLVGVRLGLWFTPKLNLLLRADCGGFGIVAYRNFDTVLEGLLGYRVNKNIRLYIGYRGRYASGHNQGNSVNGWFHGPVLGTVYSF